MRRLQHCWSRCGSRARRLMSWWALRRRCAAMLPCGPRSSSPTAAPLSTPVAREATGGERSISRRPLPSCLRARRELGVRTVFNLLGPLTNPAGATVQIVGVFSARYVELLAQALLRLGVQRAFVVHGAEGLDEISVSGETVFAEVCDGRVASGQFLPEQFGLRRWPSGALAGGDAQHNAALLRRVLAGEPGALRDAVLANAAAAFVAAGMAADVAAGAVLAAQVIDSGAAAKALETFLHVVG